MTAAKLTPRPEQEDAIQEMLEEFEHGTHSVCNASNMDTGKTLVASEVIHRMGLKRVLIVGVRDTAPQWAERLEAQSDGAIHLRIINSTKAGAANEAALLAGEDGIYFIGGQMFAHRDFEYQEVLDESGNPIMERDKKTGLTTDKVRRKRIHKGIYRKMKPVEMVIVDETHIFAANRKNIARRSLLSVGTKHRLALSGTMFGGSFENAWSITRWLWPGEDPETGQPYVDTSFHRWKAQWCEMKEVRIRGGQAIAVTTGEKYPGLFVSQLPCYIRLDGELDVPAPLVVQVDLTAPQRAQYEDLERDLLTWIQTHQGEAPLVADLPITLRQRLRTATLGEMTLTEDGEVAFAMDCASSKLQALRGILDYYGNQPVLIFTDSKRFAKVTVARMRAAGAAAVEWSGDVSATRRQEIKERFIAKDPDYQYLVAVIAAASTGLDGLQRACSKIVWLSQSESMVQNAQAVKRIYRTGVDLDEFQQVAIHARGTYDEGIFSSILSQTLSMNATLRGRQLAAA